jgi:hypothetical protein
MLKTTYSPFGLFALFLGYTLYPRDMSILGSLSIILGMIKLGCQEDQYF